MAQMLLEKPGLLFVLATLLPLASFGLLVLAGALRWALRPHASGNSGVKAIFQILGGDVTGRGPAYVALAGIALAFACSLTGFIWYLHDVHEIEHFQEKIEASHKAEHALERARAAVSVAKQTPFATPFVGLLDPQLIRMLDDVKEKRLQDVGNLNRL